MNQEGNRSKMDDTTIKEEDILLQESSNIQPQQDISTNRGTFEIKNERYTQNVKLMARLKQQTKMKGDLALQNMNEKSSGKKVQQHQGLSQ